MAFIQFIPDSQDAWVQFSDSNWHGHFQEYEARTKKGYFSRRPHLLAKPTEHLSATPYTAILINEMAKPVFGDLPYCLPSKFLRFVFSDSLY